MRRYKTTIVTINFFCMLIVCFWYLHISWKPFSEVSISISLKEQTLSSRNDRRLIRLYDKYQLLLNLSMFKSNDLSNQTMIYSCQSFCGGWGDRLRGILSVYILALLTNRRFMIDMNYPCAISKVLEPNFVNWTFVKYPNAKNRTRLNINTMRSWQTAIRAKTAETISSKDIVEAWSAYDDVYITTNSDYMTPALRNKNMHSRTRNLLGRIATSQASMQTLFPFLYELLFKPSRSVRNRVDTILSASSNRRLICLHIRIGKNPANPFDHAFTARTNTTHTMLNFLDRYLVNKSSSLIFVTSDSAQAVSDVLHHYPNSSMTVVGPILHIDRFDRRSSTICNGFEKVMADFYVLGECQTSLLSKSGFSHWANKRRKNGNEELYIYNEHVKQMRKI